MVSVEDFFLSPEFVNNISEEEYETAKKWVEAFEAMARATYQSIYVIDYNKMDFLYVSDNPLFLCGYSAEEVRKMGYFFYMQHVPENELDMLLEINKAGFNFYAQLPIEERNQYTISYDFHLQRDRRKILINHKLTPFALDKQGRIWLAVCVVSLSGNSSAGNIELRKIRDASVWRYSVGGHRWKKSEAITLSEKEKEILLLSAQGYTMNEIADRLCLAVDTIKFHKRKLFEKLEVRNITEALSMATNYRLI